MKPAIILLLLTAACRFSDGDMVKSFVAGTYVAEINQEFSTGNDTLFIIQISSSGENFKIIKHTTYRRRLDGKQFPLERKTRVSIGIYNKETKILTETPTGRIISFNPEKKELYVGAGVYNKIGN